MQGKGKAGTHPGAGCWTLAAWRRQQQDCPPGQMENLEDILLADFSTVLASSCDLSVLFAGSSSECNNVFLDQITNTSTLRRGKLCMRLLPNSSFLLYAIRCTLQIAVAVIAAQPALCCHRKA